MITVSIGSSSRKLEDIDDGWLREQIIRRRNAGQNACVRVDIQTHLLHLSLSTPGCGGGGGYRKPNPTESAVIGLWERFKLNSLNFSPSDLLAFLKQVAKYL